MAKSSFLPRRNKGYFGQKVTKTLFGNSPLNARSQTRSLLPSTGKLQFPRPLSLTRHSSLPRKAGSSGESLTNSAHELSELRIRMENTLRFTQGSRGGQARVKRLAAPLFKFTICSLNVYLVFPA